jgi:predicted transcriptional regulator
MKTFTFRYDPRPARSALECVRKAIKSGKGEIQVDSITCGSYEEMTRLMTQSRAEAFAVIVRSEPESITELAKTLGKDVGNVQRDVTALQSLGLIELKRETARRGVRIKPVARYQRFVFEYEPKKMKRVV